MNLIKAIIIEDEIDGMNFIKEVLEDSFQNVQIIGTADSVSMGVDILKKNSNIDLAFMDIQLGDGDAFDILNNSRNLPDNIIFITAYDEFALRAFKYPTVDYILKPINVNELVLSVKTCIDNIKKTNHYTIDNFKDVVNKLIIPSQSGLDFIEIDSIIRCEADSNYTKFFLLDQSVIMASKTLGDYEKTLASKGFFRTHHKHLVNLKHIVKLNNGKASFIEMVDSSSVPVSVRKKANFIETISSI